jgi:hypothetical protein
MASPKLMGLDFLARPLKSQSAMVIVAGIVSSVEAEILMG